MSEPMGDARLAHIKASREYGLRMVVSTYLREAVVEIDRLRAENERLRETLWHYAKVRLSDDSEPKRYLCACSAFDQCSCAYDCDCRERYEHVYVDPRFGEGWHNTGRALSPEATQ